MAISDIMTTRLITVTPTETAGRMYVIFEKLSIHNLLVVEDGHLLGVVAQSEVMKTISPFANTKVESDKYRFTTNRQAQQMMQKKPPTIQVNRAILEAAETMLKHNTGVLPVLNRDELLVGVLSWKDVLRYIVK
ncbi:MAG: acetoin utilization protein AcuB [Flavobacteriales bacterium]|jgi:acetoin utilization protein AcuB